MLPDYLSSDGIDGDARAELEARDFPFEMQGHKLFEEDRAVNDRSKLWQFQCQREGCIFYYQHSMRPSHTVDRCPVCGSTRVELTGRVYDPVDEAKPLVVEVS